MQTSARAHPCHLSGWKDQPQNAKQGHRSLGLSHPPLCVPSRGPHQTPGRLPNVKDRNPDCHLHPNHTPIPRKRNGDLADQGLRRNCWRTACQVRRKGALTLERQEEEYSQLPPPSVPLQERPRGRSGALTFQPGSRAVTCPSPSSKPVLAQRPPDSVPDMETHL